MIKKTIVIAGQQGERGDKAEEYSVPIDGVLGYTETGTPDGYVEAGYFKVTGLDEVDSRIDVIESLPEGSTSGDAEVADIRVGVDGEIYDSAGIAVRDQITELHDYAESIDDVQDAQIDTLKVTKAVEGEYITLNDAAALPANEYALTLSPVQSLNGYDSPWVGGGGKNLFDGSQINAWNNSNGLTITKNNDGSFVLNGKATATAYQTIPIHLPVGTYVLSGCPSGGSDTGYSIFMGSPINKYDTGDGVEFTVSEEADYNVIIPRVINGTVCDNLFIKPMICLSSAANPTTFAPYANICPIHGADEVGVRVCGVNLWDKTQAKVGYISNNTGEVVGNTNFRCTDFISIKGGESYYVKSEKTTEMWGAWYDIDKTYIQGVSDYANRVITAPQNAAYVRLTVSNVTVDDNVDKFSVNCPSSDTDYHAYNGHSTTITLPSTVYGGSVEQGGSGTSEIGFAKDEIITRIAEGTDGNADWLNVLLYTSLSLLPPSTAENREILAAKSKSNYSGFWEYQNVNGHIHFYTNRASVICAFYPKSVFPTLSDFTTYYASNKAEFAIPLATPIDISVTPFPQTLLEGVNNVWAECSEDGAVIGDAEQDLTYQRDTTLVIQNLINRIVELERRN